MKKALLITTLTIITTTLFSCNWFTSPESKKNAREYTWTVDTLRYPGSSQIHMYSIWASSPENVWVCGHSSSSQGNLWHYNGLSWEAIDLFQYIARSAMSFRWITGFNDDNIWVVGDRFLSEYDNNGNRIDYYKSIVVELRNGIWLEHEINGFPLLDIWGTSRNNIWTCGVGGYIFHFNGSEWKKDSIQISDISDKFNFQLKSLREFHGILYSQGIKWNQLTGYHTEYLFEKVNNIWTTIDSFTVGINTPRWGGLHFNKTKYGKMYSYGQGGVFRYENGLWTNILMPYTIRGMSAISENNIICGGDDGNVYHYNGTDWEEINLPQTNFIWPHAFWMFNDQVFIANYYSLNSEYITLVYKGR